MSTDAETIIRYDGPALAGHEIDIQELAPALLALADMVQLTNRRFNGDATTMKVTVRADVKQQCFMLHIHLAQSVLESAKSLFGTAEYKTAKEIAEAIDLVFPAGFGGGVFMIWKAYARRRKKDGTFSQSQVITEQRGGITIIDNIYGDGNSVSVPTPVYELSQDPEMIELGKRVMAPLARTGYDTLSFYADSKPVVEIDREEAATLREAAPEPDPVPVPEDDAVHTPIRGNADIIRRSDKGEEKWRLKWMAQSQLVAMPEDWLTEYQSGRLDIPVGSRLDVTITMTTSRTNPDAAPTYTVDAVHGIVPPESSKQARLV